MQNTMASQVLLLLIIFSIQGGASLYPKPQHHSLSYLSNKPGGGSRVKGQMGAYDSPPQITWGKPNEELVYFDDTTPTNITAVVGQKALLPCRVHNIGRKDVTWIRKRGIHILTVGSFTYTSDDRFKVVHPKDSNDWNLEISSVTFRDAGVYECQVATSPKISLPVMLTVEVQQARIPGRSDLFIQNGSTISLTCVVNTHSENVGAVTWFRDGQRLDYDSPRGGVSLEVEKTPTRTTSKLFLTRAAKSDSGNYTCAPQFADAAAVIVHVVSGEESAAVQTGGVGMPHISYTLVTFFTAFSVFVPFIIEELCISARRTTSLVAARCSMTIVGLVPQS